MCCPSFPVDLAHRVSIQPVYSLSFQKTPFLVFWLWRYSPSQLGQPLASGRPQKRVRGPGSTAVAAWAGSRHQQHSDVVPSGDSRMPDRSHERGRFPLPVSHLKISGAVLNRIVGELEKPHSEFPTFSQNRAEGRPPSMLAVGNRLMCSFLYTNPLIFTLT